ncbi:hypothetical protein RIF29_08136 [Crotalaria pallida]|uniref:F-box domain-containing protein n=1 Tax=Crotalaria pallida TaxID=3830 RepID=A0AAN9J571_CROPI
MEEKTKTKKIVNQNHVPQELIIQILLRLPVQSLLRFRCVSKLWFSLISHPTFAISHFQLSSPRLLYLPLTFHASQTRSIDLSHSLLTRSPFARPNPSFLPPTSYCDIQGSCRGFLLLRHSFRNLYLWNPSTRVHKPLSPSHIITDEHKPLFYGFGYDSSRDDYLVLRSSCLHIGVGLFRNCFEFFSLRANSWNQFEGNHLPYRNASDDPRTGTLLNGIIHWLAFRYDVRANVILAFDLTERSFSEVRLPTDFDSPLRFSNLCLLGGFLGLYVTGSRTTDIWIMKEYRVQSSWSKSIVVAIDDLPSKYFSPICSTKGGDIVGLDCSTRLVKCDAEGRVLEHCSHSDDPHGCKAYVYRESLLSLPPVAGGEQDAEDDDWQNDETAGGH